MSVCSAPNSRYSEHSADQAESKSVSAPLPTAHCVVAINGETEAASARLYKAFSTFFTPDASRLQSSQSARITRYTYNFDLRFCFLILVLQFKT